MDNIPLIKEGAVTQDHAVRPRWYMDIPIVGIVGLGPKNRSAELASQPAMYSSIGFPETVRRYCHANRRLPTWLAAITFALFTIGLIKSSTAADAPGAPGIGSAWTTGAKQGLGTSATASKVWYTIQQGILGEVYYPQVDTPNVQDLQFIITDSRTFVKISSVMPRNIR